MKLINLCLFVALVVLAASCSKTISIDTPVAKTLTPSVLVTNGNYKIYCLNPETGVKKWELPCIDKLVSSPVINPTNNNAIIADGFWLKLVDMITGKEIAKKLFKQFYATPLLVGDKLYFGNGDSVFCYNTNLDKVWAKSLPSFEFRSSPINYKGCLYVPCIKSSSLFLYCLDINNGNTIGYGPATNFTNPYITPNSGSSGTIGSPYALDDKIYINVANKVVCLKDSLKNIQPTVINNPEIWKYQNPTLPFRSSPLIYGNMCVVGGMDKNIHCIDIISGNATARWKYLTNEGIWASGAIDKTNENVLMGSLDNYMYAIDFVTGKLRWKAPTGNVINSTPVVYENKIYFNSADKNTYCLDAVTGNVIWKYNNNSQGESGIVIQTASGACIYPTELGNSAN
jgi:outer membrane protein assembly factor BamB